MNHPAAPPQSGAIGMRRRGRRRWWRRRSEAGRMKQETNGVTKMMRDRRTRVGEYEEDEELLTLLGVTQEGLTRPRERL